PLFRLERIKNETYNIYYQNNRVFINKDSLVQVTNKPVREVIINLKKSNFSKPKKERDNFTYFNGLLFLFSLIFYWVLMKYSLPKINTKFIYFVPSICFVYIVIRAFNLSFTIDEAWSYDILINKPYYFKAL